MRRAQQRTNRLRDSRTAAPRLRQPVVPRTSNEGCSYKLVIAGASQSPPHPNELTSSSVSPHGVPQRSPTRLWVLRGHGTMSTRTRAPCGFRTIRQRAHKKTPLRVDSARPPWSEASQAAPGRVLGLRGSPAAPAAFLASNTSPCSAHHCPWDARARGTSASATPGTRGPSAS